jgi:hypothetical protein
MRGFNQTASAAVTKRPALPVETLGFVDLGSTSKRLQTELLCRVRLARRRVTSSVSSIFFSHFTSFEPWTEVPLCQPAVAIFLSTYHRAAIPAVIDQNGLLRVGPPPVKESPFVQTAAIETAKGIIQRIVR